MSAKYPHRYGGEDESWKCIDCGIREYKAEELGLLECQGRCPHDDGAQQVMVLESLTPVLEVCCRCAASFSSSREEASTSVDNG
jgi:hypothetical protein